MPRIYTRRTPDCHPDRRHQAHGMCRNCYRRWRRYGVSWEDYQRALELTGGVCGVCRTLVDGTMHVDHDPKTGKVRGFLCGACNRALGLLKDDVDTLRSAIDYLS